MPKCFTTQWHAIPIWGNYIKKGLEKRDIMVPKMDSVIHGIQWLNLMYIWISLLLIY